MHWLRQATAFLNPPKTPEGERLLLVRVLALGLLIHLITAWFSVGYQSADEQFQILEFAAYKLGLAPAKDLAVEFTEKMRPWLQPAIYVGIAKLWRALGITNPHFWAASFRLFAGLVGWASALGLALCGRVWFREDARARRLLIWASGFLWFLPVLHVRPSSESLAGSAFTLGLCILTLAHQPLDRESHRPVWPWLFGGALWGLAFESRFQVAFMLAGGWLWFAIRGRAKLNRLLAILAGFAVVFALGRIVDRWGYGDWTFSPWKYVDYNLVRGEVSHYGQEPWWEIFRVSVMESWPVLGLLMAFAALVAWVRHPLHALTWAHLPFFLVHELIAHKEYRFFYPIGFAEPALIVLALSSASSGRLDAWVISRWMRPIRVFVVGLNFLALGVLASIPFARTVQFQEAAYQAVTREHEQGITPSVLYAGERDPFIVLGNPIYFYRPPGLEIRRFRDFSEVEIALGSATHAFWLFQPAFALPPEATNLLGQACHPVFRTLPDWLSMAPDTPLGHFLLQRVNVFTLYRCMPTPGDASHLPSGSTGK